MCSFHDDVIFIERVILRSEYITIVSIMICMTIWDFVIGVLFGIVVSCECSPISLSFGET